MYNILHVTIEYTKEGLSGFIDFKNTLIIGFGNTIIELLIDLMLGIKLYFEN